MEVLGGMSASIQKVICPGLDLWISTQPYKGESTGGDFHFVSLSGGGISTRVLLADVSGHGSHVYEYSEFLRNMIKRYINAKTQANFMAELNKSFADYAQLSRFATAVFGTYVARKKRWNSASPATPGRSGIKLKKVSGNILANRQNLRNPTSA